MEQSKLNPKVRSLAVVLSSCDAATRGRLLEALPAATAGAVRAAIGRLGTVSPAERQAAFDSLRPLLQPPASPSQAHPSVMQGRDRGLPRGRTAAEENPAVQLLGGAAADVAEFHSYAASPWTAQQTEAEPAAPTAWAGDPEWSEASPAEWAEAMRDERPIVVAAVLTQAPQTLAAEVLQHLPAAVAVEALAAMPKIGHTAGEVFDEVREQLRQRLRQLRSQSMIDRWGLRKARDIFDSLPEDMRRQWAEQMGEVDPDAARHFAHAHPTAAAEAGSTHAPAHLRVVHSDPEPPPPAEQRPAAGPELGFVPEPAFDPADFDALQHLPLSDLARVVSAADPETVLAALAGASRNWVARFERLIHPREVGRLRERLRAQSRRTLAESDAAQAEIVSLARRLGFVQLEPDELLAA